MSSMESSFSTLDSQKPLELPRDVMLSIFMKFEAKEILETFQFVCKSWYDLCQNPSLWRNVVIENGYDPTMVNKRHELMLCNAVDRSCGGLVKLDIEGVGGDELMYHISQRCSQLKQLRLAYCALISPHALIHALVNFPLLEELELSMLPFTRDQTIKIIRCCPSLKSFKLKKTGSRNASFLAYDDEALAIATTMPNLHILQLIGNDMTDNGLKAILDNCPHIQSLDLRRCSHVTFNGTLWKRCYEQIKDLQPRYVSYTEDHYYPSDSDEEFYMFCFLADLSDVDMFR